ncbi:MAG: flagellar motor protein MotB [Terracidiphilus sp.]
MSRRHNKSHVSHDRWLVSYADFITLLFAFFVVLYAFAKADQKKQVAVSDAIDKGFQAMGLFPDASLQLGKNSNASGSDKAAIPLNIVMGEDVLAPARVKDDLDSIQRELDKTLHTQIAQHAVSIKMGRDGLVISLREAGFFNSGSAVPRPGSMVTLRQIAESLSRTPYDVRVEGHTDNIPIHNGEFDSNWELSSARATRIARVFIDLHAIPPDRLSAAGYAEFHPVASNATADGRAENRRVDLVVMPRTQLNFAAPSPAPLSGPWRTITDGDGKPQ